MNLKFFLTLTNKLVSVNDLYKARIGYKFGHAYPIMYKNPKAVKLAAEMRSQMKDLVITPEQKEWLLKTKQFTLYLHAVFKVGISSRDASNIVKLAEDQLVNYIKEDIGIPDYDDSLHIKVISEKSVLPGSKHEFLGVCLSDYVQSVRFDKLNKPEKVWFNYNDYLEFDPLPKRKKKDTIYLQKVNKDESDTLVYIIKTESDITGLNLINLIKDLESINNLRKHNYIYVAILNKNINGVEDLFKVIEEYTKNYNGIKAEYINDSNDVINWLKNYV